MPGVEDVVVTEDLLVLVVVGLLALVVVGWLVPVPTAEGLKVGKVGATNDIVGGGDDVLGLDPPPEPPLPPGEQVFAPTVQDDPSAQPSLRVSPLFWLL